MDSLYEIVISASVLFLSLTLVVVICRLLWHVESQSKVRNDQFDDCLKTIERITERYAPDPQLTAQHSYERIAQGARVQSHTVPQGIIPLGDEPAPLDPTEYSLPR